MKALVLTKYNHLEYTDVPKPQLSDNEVLVKVKACGICGSDIHGMDGSTGRRQPPIIMGHEAAGTIAELGKKVTGWNKSDRVTFDSTIYCNNCPFCRSGRINLCDNRKVLGVSCDDYRREGAFAEFVAVPQHILYRLPGRITFEQAAMTEAVSIAFHAVNRIPVVQNCTAVVVGAGMIGLLVIQILKASGCKKIIAVDIDRQRLDLATNFGAEHCLTSDENTIENVLDLTEGKGADIAFEVVGISSTINIATGILCKGGSLVMVGNLSPTVELHLQSVVTREITLYGSCASSGEYPVCLDLIETGKIDLDPLITKTVPLAQGPQWFKRLHAREKGLMKIILCP